MKHMNVAVENRTDVDINLISGKRCVWVKLVEKEATNKIGIDWAVDIGG